MDALEFLRERERMCNSYDGCKGCPCEKARCALNSLTSDNDYKRIVVMVEEWSAAHPRKTRQDVFLEQWPEAKIDNGGCLAVCPYYVSATHRDKYGCCVVRGKSCCDCRREFWMKVVG
nr:MAG TPA: hypothetical protein [Caudoviricetes sp.]